MSAPGAGGEGAAPARPESIALVITDVDGTLVTPDKRLTAASVAAAAALARAGIGLTVASSRPPIGLRGLVADLGLRLPMAAFNGACVVGPDLAVIEESLIPEAAARTAHAAILAAGFDPWVFARGAWWLRDPEAPYADLERKTLGAEPRVATDLAPLLSEAHKIVGVGRDVPGLAALETALAVEIGAGASVHRSQVYYLDVTPPGRDKGGFVDLMARRLGIGPERIAVLGDAANDRAMFARAGFSVAMGNADAAVKAAADATTGANDSDGWAEAVHRHILA